MYKNRKCEDRGSFGELLILPPAKCISRKKIYTIYCENIFEQGKHKQRDMRYVVPVEQRDWTHNEFSVDGFVPHNK